MAQQQHTSANLIRALYNLSRERDVHKRQTLLNAGLIEMIKWFSLAARKIIEGKMKLPKQTQRFMDRHQHDVRKLASAIVDPETKRSIILKPGGGGFLGGVIIRSLIRWDGNKLMRRKRTTPKKKTKRTRKTKASPRRKRKRKDPVKARQPRARKSRKKINDKFVTKRRSKSISPLVSTSFNPSPIAAGTSWQNFGMSSPRSNARQSLTITRFSPLRAASPQQIISPLSPRQRQIALNSPTFQRRYGFAASMHLQDPKKYPMTYQTALPSEVEKIKQAKRELAMRAAKKKLRF